MTKSRFWMLAVAALLVVSMMLVVVLWPDIAEVVGTATPSAPQLLAETASAPSAEPRESGATPEFAHELGGALTDERREEMEALVARYAEPEQFDASHGACARCHSGAVPYDEGTDLEIVLASMAEAHTSALGPAQTAEILAYFTGYRP